MWARRIGLPKLWPSRIKVVIFSILSGAAVLKAFNFLSTATLKHLDLGKPVSIEMHCHKASGDCATADDPVACAQAKKSMLPWETLQVGPECVGTSMALQKTCLTVALPANHLNDPLRTASGVVNRLRAWRTIFAVLGTLLVLAVLAHDLSVLNRSCRPYVASLTTLRQQAPRLTGCLRAWTCRVCFAALRERSRVLWIIILPFYVVGQIALFCLVIYPIVVTAFIFRPVVLSRLMVFFTGIFLFIWSLTFVFFTQFTEHQAYVLFEDSNVSHVAAGTKCMCMCEYPLSEGIFSTFVTIGIVMAIGSVSLAMRSLKGLRHSHWANLIGVTYIVPIELFPVEWTRPDGTPIQHRKEGEPVQGEPAFDPFALLDEQPESGRIRVTIDRRDLDKAHNKFWFDQTTDAPLFDGSDTVVGCCGFPQSKTASSSDDDDSSDDGSSERLTGQESA